MTRQPQLSDRATLGLLDVAWLAAGGVAFAFIGFRWSTPVAAWIAPSFLLRFFRRRAELPGTLLAVPVLTLSACAKFLGFWDFPVLYQIAVCALVPAPFYLALYLDRALARRLPPASGTLVFPAALTAAEYLMGQIPNLGTTGSIATSQLPLTGLIQLGSVTGLFGITFLLGWLASTVCLLWENGFDVRSTARPALPFVVCAALAFVGGSVYVGAFAPRQATVKVGSVSAQAADAVSERLYSVVDRGTPRDEALEHRDRLSDVRAELLASSAAAAACGADVVFWSESALFVYPEEEAAFIEQARDFARAHGVFFAPAICVFRYGEHYGDNKVILIGPDGRIGLTYRKTKTLYHTDSDGIIRFSDTPFGRIGAAICFDMDFPGFVRQAGRSGVDIMLVPAWDTEGSTPYHTYPAMLRAVENGFSVVRQVSHGASMAVDYQGTVVGYQDFFRTRAHIMMCDLPIGGHRTPYSVLGDWLAFLCMAFIPAGAVWGARRARRRA